MTRRRTHGTVNRMAYDEGLAQRLREALAPENGLTERRMFGGIAFMLDGNMAVGVSSDELMVRAGPDRFDEALARPHARVFDLSGAADEGLGAGRAGRRGGRRGPRRLADAGRVLRPLAAAPIAPVTWACS